MLCLGVEERSEIAGGLCIVYYFKWFDFFPPEACYFLNLKRIFKKKPLIEGEHYLKVLTLNFLFKFVTQCILLLLHS